jgi:hypothetical protein
MGRVLLINQQLGAALGVLSVLLLSMLPPWHFAFCPATGGAESPFPQMICRGDLSSGHSRLSAGPDAPAQPQVQCPVCAGLAGLQLAIVAAVLLGLWPMILAQTLDIPADVDAANLFHLLPSSRGPPLAA